MHRINSLYYIDIILSIIAIMLFVSISTMLAAFALRIYFVTYLILFYYFLSYFTYANSMIFMSLSFYFIFIPLVIF